MAAVLELHVPPRCPILAPVWRLPCLFHDGERNELGNVESRLTKGQRGRCWTGTAVQSLGTSAWRFSDDWVLHNQIKVFGRLIQLGSRTFRLDGLPSNSNWGDTSQPMNSVNYICRWRVCHNNLLCLLLQPVEIKYLLMEFEWPNKLFERRSSQNFLWGVANLSWHWGNNLILSTMNYFFSQLDLNCICSQHYRISSSSMLKSCQRADFQLARSWHNPLAPRGRALR